MVLSMERWKGKVAIVTGASSGIGAAIAEKLVLEGLQVVGIARRVELVQKQAANLQNAPGKLHAYKADMSKEAEIIAVYDWTLKNLGPVHIVINNAGVLLETSIINGDSDLWRSVFDTNVLGVCVSTREAVRQMAKHNVEGHIIQISGLAAYAVFDLIPEANVYAASKHALRAVNETVRMELADSKLKIKIGCVSPGAVDTDIINSIRAKNPELNKVFDEGMTSMDVADATIFALSTPPNVQIQDILMRPCFSS